MNTDSPLYLPMVALTILIFAVAIAAVLVAFRNWNLSDRYSDAAADADAAPVSDGDAAKELTFQAYERKRRATQLAAGAAVALIMVAFGWALPAILSGLIAT